MDLGGKLRVHRGLGHLALHGSEHGSLVRRLLPPFAGLTTVGLGGDLEINILVVQWLVLHVWLRLSLALLDPHQGRRCRGAFR
jgi:hypothetical protein